MPKGIFPVFRDRITNRAREIAKLIDPIAAPILVPYRKERRARQGECFAKVREHVSKAGGEVVDGWVVWETPPLMVQAEFHSIWRNPDGHLVDITPPLHGGASVTFVHAVPGHVYQGRNTVAYSIPYDDNAIARRWVEISKRFQELAYPAGELQTPSFRLTAEMQSLMAEKGEILRLINASRV